MIQKPSTTKNNKNTFFIFLVAVVVVVFLLPSVSLVEAQITTRDYKDQIQEIDVGIQRFNAIELDVSFLSSPGFRDLKDFSVNISQPVTVGRVNPFEPLPDLDPEDFLVLPERQSEEEVLTVSTEENISQTTEESTEFDTSFLDDFLF